MKVTDRHVFFYREWPSNFCRASFAWMAFGELHKFFSTEQAFMWAKAMYFGDFGSAAKILEAKRPMEAKMLGRQVKGYDDKKWNLARYGFMYDVNYCKYTQNTDLMKRLLFPGYDGKTFVEASPTDCIWGIGLGENQPGIDDERNWKGKNLLGNVITEVRRAILSDS